MHVVVSMHVGALPALHHDVDRNGRFTSVFAPRSDCCSSAWIPIQGRATYDRVQVQALSL